MLKALHCQKIKRIRRSPAYNIIGSSLDHDTALQTLHAGFLLILKQALSKEFSLDSLDSAVLLLACFPKNQKVAQKGGLGEQG